MVGTQLDRILYGVVGVFIGLEILNTFKIICKALDEGLLRLRMMSLLLWRWLLRVDELDWLSEEDFKQWFGLSASCVEIGVADQTWELGLN